MSDALSGQSPAVIKKRGGRPLVSVFASVLNEEAYIEQALRSVLAQTVDDFELLVADDGSSDRTPEIIAGLDDPRIRLFRNGENLGMARSLNRLLDMAGGKYLAHMDGDDINLPERLEKQIALLEERREVWVCGCHYSLFGSRDIDLHLPLESDEIKAGMLFGCLIPHPFATFRGETFRKHGIRYAEKMTCALDYELWLRIAVTRPEAAFANADALLGRYRQHARQLSQARREEQRQMGFRAQKGVFTALGISPADRRMRAHQYLYQRVPVPDKRTMAEVREWAEVLRAANERSGLFARDHFEGFLSRRLKAVLDEHPQFASLPDLPGKTDTDGPR